MTLPFPSLTIQTMLMAYLQKLRFVLFLFLDSSITTPPHSHQATSSNLHTKPPLQHCTPTTTSTSLMHISKLLALILSTILLLILHHIFAAAIPSGSVHNLPSHASATKLGTP
jgi:hypothetical protein